MVRRLMQSKLSSVILVVAVVIVGVLALATFELAAFQGALNDVKAVLSNYSEELSTGRVTQGVYYAPAMQDLIQERRRFYNEYFEVGLYSTLESVRSEFDSIEPGVPVISKDHLSVKATEKVILRGRCRDSSEENPRILAGRWALARTNNERAKQELEKYIQSGKEDTRQCYEEGFETTLLVYHNLVMARTQTGLQIVQDSFTDSDQDKMDRVVWANSKPVRNKPDFTTMPDYQVHILPIEELGKTLLDKVTKDYGE